MWCSTRRWTSKSLPRVSFRGFIQGGSYEEVPLEKMAHALESRFSQNSTQVFSVDDEVRQWREAQEI